MNARHRSGTTRTKAAIAAAVVTLTPMGFMLDAPAAEAAPPPTVVVTTAKTGLGQVLVDARGRTLYLFEKDRNGRSACVGQCAKAWPPLLVRAKPRAAGAVKAPLLGTTKRGDGRLQATYHNHPLYTFVKDTGKGQTHGENVDGFGAEWYALSAAGVKVQ